MMFYKTVKRTAVSPTIYDPTTGTSGNAQMSTGGANSAQTATIQTACEQGFSIIRTGSGVYTLCFCHFTCDAEI